MTLVNAAFDPPRQAALNVKVSGGVLPRSVRMCWDKLCGLPGFPQAGPLGEWPLVQPIPELGGQPYRIEQMEDGSVRAVLATPQELEAALEQAGPEVVARMAEAHRQALAAVKELGRKRGQNTPKKPGGRRRVPPAKVLRAGEAVAP